MKSKDSDNILFPLTRASLTEIRATNKESFEVLVPPHHRDKLNPMTGSDIKVIP